MNIKNMTTLIFALTCIAMSSNTISQTQLSQATVNSATQIAFTFELPSTWNDGALNAGQLLVDIPLMQNGQLALDMRNVDPGLQDVSVTTNDTANPSPIFKLAKKPNHPQAGMTRILLTRLDGAGVSSIPAGTEITVVISDVQTGSTSGKTQRFKMGIMNGGTVISKGYSTPVKIH